MKKYTTVFLDWNKTLSHSKFWGHWQEDNHPHNPIFKSIQSSLFTVSSNVINDWMKGKYSSEEVIKSVAEQTKQDYQLLLEEFIKSCKEMEYSSSDILDLVRELRKKGIRVVIATDNMDCFTRWTVPALQLDKVFDGVLSSYDLKLLKGETDKFGRSIFFEKFLNSNKLKGNEAVLIDDSLRTKDIVEKSNIDFLLATKEEALEHHLKMLLAKSD